MLKVWDWSRNLYLDAVIVVTPRRWIRWLRRRFFVTRNGETSFLTNACSFLSFIFSFFFFNFLCFSFHGPLLTLNSTEEEIPLGQTKWSTRTRAFSSPFQHRFALKFIVILHLDHFYPLHSFFSISHLSANHQHVSSLAEFSQFTSNSFPIHALKSLPTVSYLSIEKQHEAIFKHFFFSPHWKNEYSDSALEQNVRFNKRKKKEKRRKKKETYADVPLLEFWHRSSREASSFYSCFSFRVEFSHSPPHKLNIATIHEEETTDRDEINSVRIVQSWQRT